MSPALSEDEPLIISVENESAPFEVENLSARAKAERRLVRKLDIRMSILVVIYIMNYIDRNNAAAARLKGFEKDLNLEGNQFASILSVLYVGYLIMQIPSNMFLHYIGRPSLYLPGMMCIWGVISVATGLTTNFTGALITRFFVGLTEAAFFPGSLFLISKWYKPNELSQRTALLTAGSLLSNAFGSLIASGILDSMDGVLGYAAWRWLFIVEGSLTVLVAFSAIFILPDFPESPSSASWLTPIEQAIAIDRVRDYSTKNSTSGLLLALRDGKVWYLAMTLTCLVLAQSFNAYFPTLAATMGYKPTFTLLACVPPWLFATGTSIVIARHSDHTQERFWHIAASYFVGILGFALSILTMNAFVRYVSLFLMAQMTSGFICFLAWTSSTIGAPPAKRAVGLALINMVSSSGNVLGAYAWPASWGPTYTKSYSICILASLCGLGMSWMFRRHLKRMNADGMVDGTGFRYML